MSREPSHPLRWSGRRRHGWAGGRRHGWAGGRRHGGAGGRRHGGAGVGVTVARAGGYATLIQRQSSGIVGRLPYDRIPTRKIFAVAQKNTAIVAMEIRIVRAMCHIGGSATRIRTYIVIGPKTGESENATDSGESGFVMIATRRNHGSIMIIVMGAMSCCASFSELLTAPPIA